MKVFECFEILPIIGTRITYTYTHIHVYILTDIRTTQSTQTFSINRALRLL